jgi:hypothetical protein
LSTKSGFLITGNRKHFPFHTCRGIRTCSPSEFLACL